MRDLLLLFVLFLNLCHCTHSLHEPAKPVHDSVTLHQTQNHEYKVIQKTPKALEIIKQDCIGGYTIDHDSDEDERKQIEMGISIPVKDKSKTRPYIRYHCD